ncbi:right-handed parallel beta-helix repeat-containing protein, partial [bacterium]|nr:right-handed parallel beta-helix repeat-containing protein [bacterium]
GTEFKTWQNTTRYTKSYVVDQNHPLASDTNPGTIQRPFRTINQAARVMKAGERVVIKSGVYREKVVPRFGGKSPEKMISYEAASGARVILKGSRVLKSAWVRSLNPTQFSEKLWMNTMPDSIFPEESPFKIQNASTEDIEIMPWAREWSGRVPYTLPRGLVFQDERRMMQLATYEDLVRVPGSYWVDSTGTILHVHPYDEKDPNETIMEVTVLQNIFKPDRKDPGYIRISGLTIMHAGNGLPRTGVGALFTMGGHHWLIENNQFKEMNSVAVEIGSITIETSDRATMRQEFRRAFQSPGHVIVRNNVISNCGTGGIQGYVLQNALVEKNHLYNIGWQDVERYWENAAVKLLRTTDTLVRKNLVHNSGAGSAIWLDWDIRNSRITQNTVYNMVMCCNGALFIEAAQVPNLIDHNILWDIQGVPIYTGNTDSLTVAYNLIGPSSGPGILSKVGTDRSLNGRPLTSRHNRIFNNIFYQAHPMQIEDPDNTSNHNVFSSEFNLVEWQKHGFDRSSHQLEMTISLDKEYTELTIETQELLPIFKNNTFREFDFFDKSEVNQMPAGPFADRFARPVVLNIDPLRQ